MKFAHMADCHVGSWRDPKLKDLSIKAFSKAINICIENRVDFIIIAGDLFNNSLPGIDILRLVVKELNKLKEENIPVYIIPGSHDYSPSGKTMIDVFEEAGLVKNVFKGHVENNKLFLHFTRDKKTGVKITGILGRRGTLEKKYYEALDIESLEKESGKKIFVFHSAISELMPKDFALVESTPLSMLPKGFEYYAGGHIHIVKHESLEYYKHISYPGPLFPASFSEMEQLGNGGFYVYEDGELFREEINLKNTLVLNIDVNHKSPEEANAIIFSKLGGKELINTIVLIRIYGTLSSGRVSDIKFNEIFDKIYSQGAFYVMRNTSKLQSEEFEEIRIVSENIDDLEDIIINEHLQQFKVFEKEKEKKIIKDLMKVFESEKHEGEKVHEYEDRIRKDANKVLDV